MILQMVTLFLFVVLGFLPAPLHAGSESERERILAAFSPYRGKLPRVDGITPGMKLDRTNAHVASTVLPPEIFKYLAAGDFAVTVQETTDMPLRQEYIDATLMHYDKVVVG